MRFLNGTNVFNAGSAGTPVVAFVNSTTSGLYSSASGVLDLSANGFRVASLTSTGTAVNYLELHSSAAGTTPSISAKGTDTNIDLTHIAKGLGSHSFQSNVGGTIYQSFVFGFDATPTGPQNYPQFSASNSGVYPYLQASGGDTNIGLDFIPKGTAPVRVQGDFQVNKTLTVQGVKQTSRVASTAGINTTSTYITQAYPIPANTLQVGDSFEFFVHGVCTATTATTNGSTFTIRMGTAGTVADTAVLAVTTTSAAGTAIPFFMSGSVTVRTIGATGTATAAAQLANSGTTGVANTMSVVAGTGATSTIVTTGALFLGVSYAATVTTVTCTFHNAIVRKIL